MRPRWALVWLTLVVVALPGWMAPPVQAVSAFSPAVATEQVRKVRSVWLRPPSATLKGEPLQVLVALHGMGGNGEDFARDLVADADRNRWLIVAPTIDYGDWRDPQQVADEEPALIEWLSSYLDALSSQYGFTSHKRVFLLGHSRGAQLAHRFALFHPERVLAVASLSAGTYTIPVARNPQGRLLTFPFGVGDLPSYLGTPLDRAELRNVQFWVGVGSEDNNPADLPRQWDPYIGGTRLQRAQAFQLALQEAGERSVLAVYGGVRHGLTPEMRSGACTFFRGIGMADTGVRVNVLKARQPIPY